MYYTYIDYLYKEVGLVSEDIEAIAQSGSNDEAVKLVCSQEYIVRQFNDISSEKFISAAKSLVCDDDIETRDQAIEFIVWTAAWDLFDDPNSDYNGSEE